MTCIVGIEHKGSVYIGGDSAGTAGDFSQRVIANSKVFLNGEFAFGCCGSPKVLNVLKNMKFSAQEKSVSDENFVASVFAKELEDAMIDAYCVKEHKGEHVFDANLLVGYKGRLYTVESNFQIIMNSYPFQSVGAGEDIAIGSLHATKDKRLSPEKKIIMALEAAAINNATVRPPFNIVVLKKKSWII